MSATPRGKKGSEPGSHLLRERINDVFLELIPEAIATISILVIIALTDRLFKVLIGEDARFFDTIKVKWVFDSGDLTILLRFLWSSLRSFRL